MSLRTIAGALIHDVPRFLRVPWIEMRNRSESITGDGRGIRCNWEFTSDLHIARVFPSAGARLMRKAFAQWPIGGFSGAPASSPARTGGDAGAPLSNDSPQVSFVIGHRGLDRLPHLLMTLRSIAGQTDVAVECVVVEQSATREIESRLPPWVRYVHTPSTDDYNRAWTLNAGVAAARGEVVVLHDNDMLVPARYAAECLARANEGWDFFELKRFTFYLDDARTREVFETGKVPTSVPSTIVQNLLGATIAARRSAYLAIGGFDESFVGWGGEDNEFWERAEVGGKAYRFGYLPFLHLYHAPQKAKLLGNDAPAVRRYQELRVVPAEERIRRLTMNDER